MAISLNNHETRIKKLEESGVSTWQKGSNSNGYWAKETTTGLIIQWGVCRSRLQIFPTPFTTTPSVILGCYGSRYEMSWAALFQFWSLTTTQFNTIGDGEAGPKHWFAIGYLISDRILNYIYKAFAIIFTLIFGIRLVSKFTV